MGEFVTQTNQPNCPPPGHYPPSYPSQYYPGNLPPPPPYMGFNPHEPQHPQNFPLQPMPGEVFVTTTTTTHTVAGSPGLPEFHTNLPMQAMEYSGGYEERQIAIETAGHEMILDEECRMEREYSGHENGPNDQED